MNYSVFILFLVLFIIIFYEKNNIKNYLIKQKIKKHKERKFCMNELLKNYLDKDCIIYLISGSTVDGIIKEINQNALIIANDKDTQIVNIEYIIRVKEYPKNKNGKRKSVVF